MENSLLVGASIYLAAVVIAVPLAKRIGLGAVLGYLIAGMTIGPWGLGLIVEVNDILHLSEFGVVLLLFLIGLELEPKRLSSLRRQIFGWGSAQVLLVTACLFAAGLLLQLAWQTALIAALGLSLSSTALAMATLNERRLVQTPAGNAGFSILLFQDIAAIPMIALVPMLGAAAVVRASGAGAGAGAATDPMMWLKVAAVVVGLVVSGRYLMRPVLRLIAGTGLREVFTAFALLLVIAIGLLMQSVGLSMALGTFVAGVLLADSEYRHALESDLEPFKGLLLGLFFSAVGMSVDAGLLASKPLQVFGLVVLFVSIKITVLYLLAKWVGIPKAQQALFAVLLSQGGEFAFVLFSSAAAAGVFSTEVNGMLVLVVTLSMVATPILLLMHDRWIAPRHRGQQREDDQFDLQENPVIIAGFGRFGQVVGRLLFANRINVTVLDHDPDQVDLLRRFGFKVFYGDPTRIDLLHTAGAAKAKIMLVAIDDVEDSLKLVEVVREAFPHLVILARARNVSHYHRMMDLGVTILERETFESALLMGRHLLEQLGFGAWHARQSALKFRAHNIRTLLDLYPHYKNSKRMVSMAKQARDELENMFARDIEALEKEKRSPW